MSHEPTLSRDARLLLAAIASHDQDSVVIPVEAFISEIPIRQLARQARMSVAAAHEAAREINAASLDGITVEGDNVILRH
jgi:hypothetical protein